MRISCLNQKYGINFWDTFTTCCLSIAGLVYSIFYIPFHALSSVLLSYCIFFRIHQPARMDQWLPHVLQLQKCIVTTMMIILRAAYVFRIHLQQLYYILHVSSITYARTSIGKIQVLKSNWLIEKSAQVITREQVLTGSYYRIQNDDEYNRGEKTRSCLTPLWYSNINLYTFSLLSLVTILEACGFVNTLHTKDPRLDYVNH